MPDEIDSKLALMQSMTVACPECGGMHFILFESTIRKWYAISSGRDVRVGFESWHDDDLRRDRLQCVACDTTFDFPEESSQMWDEADVDDEVLRVINHA